ncbi:MAG TPA: hypothetical protein VIA80_02415 [Hyphomonadaceae bacterium]|jgi:hypothetical protein
MKPTFLPALAPVLAFVLAACTPEGSEVIIDSSEVTPPVPRASDLGPAGLDAHTWLFDSRGRNDAPRLRYGAAGNEEVAITFECRSTGKVTIVLDRLILGRKPKDWPFTLTSGGEEQSFTGRLSRMQEDHMLVETVVPASDPILVALSLSGELSLDDSSRLSPLPLDAVDDSERQAIADFLEACPLS